MAYYYFYQTIMVFSLLAAVFIVALTWRYRHSLAARAMIVLAVSTFIWTLGFLIEVNSTTLSRQLFFNNVGYLGTLSTPTAWLFFAWFYTTHGKPMSGRKLAVLLILPVGIMVLVWTNHWHHLMWSDEHLAMSGPFLITAKTYGPLFWTEVAYNYIITITGTTLLIRQLFIGVPLYRNQAISLLAAIGLPLLWNVIYVFKLLPLPRVDLTPCTFAISGVIIAVGFMRFSLFKAVPFAHKFVIQQLNEGIFVFDSRDRLLEANPAAMKIAGVDQEIIGKELREIASLSPVLGQMDASRFGRRFLRLILSGKEVYYSPYSNTPTVRSRDGKIPRSNEV